MMKREREKGMIYFDSPQAKVSWDEALQAVVVEWKGFTQGEQLRTPADKAFELLVQKKACKYLADTRKMSAISQHDQDWIASDWFPRASQVIKFFAYIVPEKVVGRSSVNRVVSLAECAYAIENFDSYEEAVQWLGEVKLMFV
jgi:hypothetical protein